MYCKIFCIAAIGVMAGALVLGPESTLALQSVALLAFLTATFFPTMLLPGAISQPAVTPRKVAI